MIRIDDRWVIPDHELSVSFARSGGPGGQNVNKVSSKVHLRWSVLDSRALPASVHARLLQLLGARLTQDGCVLFSSDQTRDQAQNLAIAEGKLRALVLRALVPPKPRRSTRPTRGSKERRLRAKEHRGRLKAGRGAREEHK